VARPPWLTRNLAAVSVVSLLQDTASELMYPLLPLFLVVTLGAPVAVVGVGEGLADGAAALAKYWAGQKADRERRRPLIAIGYGAAAVAKLIVATAFVWPVVLAGRMLDRLGKGVRGVPRDALIADEAAPGDRGRAFGFHRAADTTGAVIGPLLGLGLYDAFGHRIRPALLVAVLPAVASVLAVGFIREARAAGVPPPGPSGETTGRRRTPPSPRGTRPSPAPIGTPARRVIAALSVFALINSSDALLLLRARRIGLGVGAVIGSYVLYNAVYALVSYPAGALSDRWSRRTVVAVGFAVFGVVYLAIGRTTSTTLVWFLFAGYGCYTALTDGVTKAWLADVAPHQARGRVLGLQAALAGGGAVLAGLWSGLLWHSSGRLPLTISGLVALVLAVTVGLGVWERGAEMAK
jgi:MFS family permease